MKRIQDLFSNFALVAITIKRYEEPFIGDTFEMHLESMTNPDTINCIIEIPQDRLYAYDWGIPMIRVTEWAHTAMAAMTPKVIKPEVIENNQTLVDTSMGDVVKDLPENAPFPPSHISIDPGIYPGLENMDITGAEYVQIQIRADRKVVWVNVDGVCRLRICNITKKVEVERQ